MDHLARPQNSIASFVVPILCDPSKCHEFMSARPKGKNWIRVASDAALQSWLYYGCLNEVFKLASVKFDLKEFVAFHDNKMFVTTNKLPNVIQKWNERVTALPQRQRDKEFNKIDKILDNLCDCTHELQNSSSQSSERAVIVESIVILGWTLQSAAYRIYRGRPMLKSLWKMTQHSEDRLVKAGFCPSEIKTLATDVDVGGLYYVESLRSPRADFDHSSCTKVACRSRGIKGEYKIRHIPECNGCGEFIKAPETMVDIIKRDGIPIVAWNNSESRIDVIEYRPEKNYVAISHVWSDGLGNETANSIPRCQITRIQNLVENLYGKPRKEQNRDSWGVGPPKLKHGSRRDPSRKPIGFWLDTLCVPVDNEEYRRQTIRKMRNIYEYADRTLILDNWVLEIPLSANIVDKVARLYLSNWQHRLWTFQEAALAQNLFIQFQDGPDTLEHLNDEWKIYQDVPSKLHCEFVGKMLPLIPYFSLEEFQPFPLPERFQITVMALRSRLTSKITDETVCLSTILALDPQKVLNLKNSGLKGDELADQQMKTFLTEIGRFDQNIIFNDLPRLPIDGFHWAPKSYLGQHGGIYTDEPSEEFDYPGQLQKDNGGLRVLFPGIQLQSVGPHLREKIWVVDAYDFDNWCRVILHPEECGRYLSWDSKSSYAILSSRALGDELRRSDKTENRNKITTEGILGIVEDERYSTIVYKCRVTLEWPKESEAAVLAKKWTKRLVGRNNVKFTDKDEECPTDFPVFGEWLSGQCWDVR